MQDLLQRRIANTLDRDKEYLVRARLAPLVYDGGYDSIADLVAAARGGNRAVQDHIVESMTINETTFFRDLHPFRTVSEVIVPDLLRSSQRSLRMWSAAAATGQEAYSLAILMADDFPSAAPPDILGTDVAESVLQRARSRTYTQLEVNRGLPARALLRHFEQDGRNWRVKSDVARHVRFERLNLSQPWRPLPTMDLILLRNVLIYFDEATRRDVLERVIARLRPGGYLLLGSAETMLVRSDVVERLTFGATVCFRARE